MGGQGLVLLTPAFWRNDIRDGRLCQPFELTATAGFRYWSGAGIYPVLHFTTAALAAGAAITVGLVFGTYPARRAASLSPIDAIARE